MMTSHDQKLSVRLWSAMRMASLSGYVEGLQAVSAVLLDAVLRCFGMSATVLEQCHDCVRAMLVQALHLPVFYHAIPLIRYCSPICLTLRAAGRICQRNISGSGGAAARVVPRSHPDLPGPLSQAPYGWQHACAVRWQPL